ncbi:MAG: DUF6431 domain-containing protein [Bryobacteraceae bacterium]
MLAGGPSRQSDFRYRTPRSERQGGSGVIPLRCLPRRCPVCEADTIIGHGRRLRQAHDEARERIWIRRGVCRQCRNTFTVLPDWLVPFGHYGLCCRQEACERIGNGETAERAAPDCKDAARLPDAATVRRWVRRRLLSVCCWAKIARLARCTFAAPTIFAWDLTAYCRMLRFEAKSP